MLRWFGWTLIRLLVTFACIFTVQNIIHQEGYLISLPILLAASAAVIVGVRIWMPAKG